MKPDSPEWYRAAQHSLAALRAAESLSRELREDLDHEERILAELIAEAETDDERR
jgi:hypothetical protein